MSIKNFDETHLNYVTKEVLSKSSNFRAATDDEYLKLELCVRDENYATRLLLTGVTIRIDPTGGKEPSAEIKFPSMADRPNPPAEGGPADRRRERSVSAMANEISEKPTMLIIGENPTCIPAQCVSIGMDDCGFLTYTVLVPIQEITQDVTAGKKWNFCIYSAAMDDLMSQMPPRDGDRATDTDEARRGMPPGGQEGGMPLGGMGGGMGGMRGGMPPGGMGGNGPGGPGMRQPSDKSQSTMTKDKIEQWVKIKYSDMRK